LPTACNKLFVADDTSMICVDAIHYFSNHNSVVFSFYISKALFSSSRLIISSLFLSIFLNRLLNYKMYFYYSCVVIKVASIILNLKNEQKFLKDDRFSLDGSLEVFVLSRGCKRTCIAIGRLWYSTNINDIKSFRYTLTSFI
jgi:hypothetical protein